MSQDEYRRTPVRDVAIGVGVAGFAIWLTFFATVGMVDVATLVVAVVALIWFSTTDPARLLDSRRRPNMMLFALTGLGVAVVLTAALVIGTGTMFLVFAVAGAAMVVGIIRAVLQATKEA